MQIASVQIDVRPKHLGHGHHYLVDSKDLLYEEGPIGGDNTGIYIDEGYTVLFDAEAVQ